MPVIDEEGNLVAVHFGKISLVLKKGRIGKA